MNSTRFLNDKVVSVIENKNVSCKYWIYIFWTFYYSQSIDTKEAWKQRPIGKVEFYKIVVVNHRHYYY